MMDQASLSELFDKAPDIVLSEETKSSCKKVSDYFGELIHKDEDNVFSAMAHGNKQCLSEVLKISIPGQNVCNIIEQVRKSIFRGDSIEKITALYLESIEKTFNYIDFINMDKKISVDDAIAAVIAFYETYGKRCFTIDEQLLCDVKNGKASSFKPFFIEYLTKFREQMKDIMLVCSFGAERNYEASYRYTTYKYIELLLNYVILESYSFELHSHSFETFTKELTDDIVRDSEAFYQLWLKVNNSVIGNAFEGEEFADHLFSYSNTYNELMVESKKLYEINLGYAPLVKESEMRELYKTVYELRKELDEVKKQLSEVKGC